MKDAGLKKDQEHSHDHGHGHSHSHGHDHGHDHDHASGGIFKAPFIVGVILFIGALLLKYLPFTEGMDFLHWPIIGLFGLSYILVGKLVLTYAFQNIKQGIIFDENFLMTIASLGAFLIGEYPEAVSVMIFYMVGEHLQDMAVASSRKSISSLMDILPDLASIKLDGHVKEVPAEEVAIGEIMLVNPGEKIPLDGIIIKGKSSLDMKALTGEAIPVDVSEGTEVLSGSINISGQLEIRVSKLFADSTASKILDMVENAQSKKSRTENFITTFAKYYTPAVVGLAVLLAIVPPVLGFGTFYDWLYRALVFLVVSCPCALVISIPLGYFGGVGAASRKGILVKGGNYLDALTRLEAVVFDKTGTLTTGEFKVQRILPAEGVSEDDLLEAAVYAELNSNHPIALSIIEEFQGRGRDLDAKKISDVKEIAGKGTSVQVGARTILAGNRKLMEGIEITVPKGDGTTVFIASGGKYLGSILISDEVKDDSAILVEGLKSRGISNLVMLTGDNEESATNVGKAIGLEDIRPSLLPADKVAEIEGIMDKWSDGGKKTVAFMGDGINDAPVLARADVGFAMGGVGSDAAIEAADVVIMDDQPSKILKAIDIARKTRKIVWQNIGMALGVKAVVLILASLGIANMWLAIFADVGVAILATLNSIRTIRD